MSLIPIKDTILYRICQENPLIYADLEPVFQGKLQAEVLIENDLARTEEEGNHLRIFINYVNTMGTAFQKKMVFNGNLDTLSSCDKLIDDYVVDRTEGNITSGQVWEEQYRFVFPKALHAIIHSLAMEVLDSDDAQSPSTINLSCILAAVYNHPLDIMLHINESHTEGGGFETNLAHMWVVKKR